MVSAMETQAEWDICTHLSRWCRLPQAALVQFLSQRGSLSSPHPVYTSRGYGEDV